MHNITLAMRLGLFRVASPKLKKPLVLIKLNMKANFPTSHIQKRYAEIHTQKNTLTGVFYLSNSIFQIQQHVRLSQYT